MFLASLISIFILFFNFSFCSEPSSKLVSENVDEIFELLQFGAQKDYIGEPISQLEHALQCAQLAKNAGADDETIIAALLHDIGHLCAPDATNMNGYGTFQHEIIGSEYALAHGFSQKVAALIKGHVDAKRYLTAKLPGYYEALSPASKKTLKMQGGPMSSEEAVLFERDELFAQKLMMRTWDEQAKIVGYNTDSLESYREMLLSNCVIKN